MRKFPRFISKQIGKVIPFNILVNRTTPVFLPFYHVVSDKVLPHVLNYNYRTVDQFEKELDTYLNYFKPVSLEELYQNPIPRQKVFHLSFDDGLKECHEVIAPILLKKGIPATFFLNSGFSDNTSLFHRYKASLILSELRQRSPKQREQFLSDFNLTKSQLLALDFTETRRLEEMAKSLQLDFNLFLSETKPYLSNEQVLDLYNMGFTIGAHSHNHPEFWKLSAEEQLLEIKNSMDWINNLVQPKLKAFAFPFTDYGVPPSVFKQLFAENICDITFGTSGLKYDEFEFHFQRYPVENSGNFMPSLKSEWVYFMLRELIGKEKVLH